MCINANVNQLKTKLTTENLWCDIQRQMYTCEEAKCKTQHDVGGMCACNVSDISIQFTKAVANHANSTWDLLLKALCMRRRV